MGALCAICAGPVNDFNVCYGQGIYGNACPEAMFNYKPERDTKMSTETTGFDNTGEQRPQHPAKGVTPAELRERAIAEAEDEVLDTVLAEQEAREGQEIPETDEDFTTGPPDTAPFVARRFRPVGDKILLENIANAAMSVGGIVIPDSVAEDYQWAVVRGIGEGRLLENGTRGNVIVSLGDKVLYHKRLVIEIKVGGNKYYIAEENSILIKGTE